MKAAIVGLFVALCLTACSDAKRVKELEAQQRESQAQVEALKMRLADQEKQRSEDEMRQKGLAEAQLVREQKALLNQIIVRLRRVFDESDSFSYRYSLDGNRPEEVRLTSLCKDQAAAALSMVIELESKGFSSARELNELIRGFTFTYGNYVSARKTRAVNGDPSSELGKQIEALANRCHNDLRSTLDEIEAFKIK